MVRKIGQGSFGEIYEAIDQRTNSMVAVKLEPISTREPQLEYEAKLLAYLQEGVTGGLVGFNKLYYYGAIKDYRAMVIDRLGPSLSELFERCGGSFDVRTTAMVGIQIVDRLEAMHRKMFLHRDIKPDNFLIGTHQHCGIVYAIDFGLSKRYWKNGDHIPYRDGKHLIGTPRYASINCHLGIEQSRRDDLESVIYMLLYFLKGVLPWQNLKSDQGLDKYEKILEKKLAVSVESLCFKAPQEYVQMVNYAR